MLTPIDASTTPAALDLLAAGFPARSTDYWVNAFRNIRQFGGNEEAGVPAGYLLNEGAGFAGVVLTPASVRRKPDGTVEKVVNLASWYMKPEQRWRAPVMMRTLLRQPDCVFTDLTPTAPVQRMLTAFGFRQLTAGVTVNVLTTAALRWGSGGELIDLEEAPESGMDPAARSLLAAHRPFDCLAAAMRHEGRWHPLLFKYRRLLKLPAAVLIYSECNAALYRNLGAVARYLLRRGRLLLVLDMPLAARAPGWQRVAKTPRFARGGVFEGRTDHAGSELALFDW